MFGKKNRLKTGLLSSVGISEQSTYKEEMLTEAKENVLLKLENSKLLKDKEQLQTKLAKTEKALGVAMRCIEFVSKYGALFPGQDSTAKTERAREAQKQIKEILEETNET